MPMFSGPEGISTYQAIVIKHAIKFYAKTGMKVNRSYTPTNMLAVAGKITGQTYKRGQFDRAVADLETWIAANGTTGSKQSGAQAPTTIGAQMPIECQSLDNPMRFALAGNARFTIVSKATGVRFTFKVKQSEDNATMHFVSVLTGPDNWENYSYLGYVRRGVYFHGGAKAKIAATAPSAKAFDWFWRLLSRSALPDTVEVFHEGKCGRCGRALTVPESIQSGFGPECIGKV